MSSMKKRIPMFLLALAMMVAMALPTFADSPSVYSSLGDSVSSVQNTYYQLNAATEGHLLQVLFLLCGTILVATPSAGILSRVRARLTIGSKTQPIRVLSFLIMVTRKLV